MTLSPTNPHLPGLPFSAERRGHDLSSPPQGCQPRASPPLVSPRASPRPAQCAVSAFDLLPQHREPHRKHDVPNLNTELKVLEECLVLSRIPWP